MPDLLTDSIHEGVGNWLDVPHSSSFSHNVNAMMWLPPVFSNTQAVGSSERSDLTKSGILVVLTEVIHR